jgi:hypothetical protein
MAKETEQEIGPASQPSKSPVGLLAYLSFGLGGRVAHPLFDVPVTFLLRVQLRGIRGQPFHGDLGMLGQEGFDRAGAVDLQTVPDDDYRSGDLTPEVFQMRDGVFAVDRMVEMLLIDLARCRQSDRRRDLTSLAHALLHRGLSTGCPGRVGPQLIREPRFIDEDDHGAPTASLFLMRGQSRSSQAWINSSSRSRARIAGTCADQPSSLSRAER